MHPRVLLLTRTRSRRSDDLADGLTACGLRVGVVEGDGGGQIDAIGFAGSNPILSNRTVCAHDRAFAIEIDDPAWLIEDDVEWRSPEAAAAWLRSFDAIDAGLVAFDIEPRSQCPRWANWPTVAGSDLDAPDAWRCFAPVCRICPRLAAAVRLRASTHGRLAFFEIMLPTLASRLGLHMHCIAAGASIMRWRPEVGDDEAAGAFSRGAVLLHPRKHGLA